MKFNTIWEAARDEGRIEGRDEAYANVRSRLISELGMSPEEADKFVNPVLAGAN
ncbi:MAG: hypothetical protein IJP88_10310 [Synergistaceae bacterium]|nr:hypothetical protein [Synergistaceae bacterium]